MTLFIELIGLLFSAIAVATMDLDSNNPPMLPILLLFMAGNVMVAFASYKKKHWGIVSLMSFYFVLNVLGLIKL